MAETRPVTASASAAAAAKDIAFGSVAGVVGKIIEYPFDTVKVRLQAQPDGLPLRYQGPIDCFRQSLAQDGEGGGGWRGLYRGVSAPMVGAAVETSCLFFSYRIAQSALRSVMPSQYPPSSSSAAALGQEDPLPLSSLVACGALSGAFTSLALTPIELVKCQMQMPASSSSSSRPRILPLIASIYKNHGLLGFWHGQLGTLIRETGGSAAWFGSYEWVSLLFRRYYSNVPASTSASASTGTGPLPATPSDAPLLPLPVWQQMLAGACAGMSYNLIFFPADTIKSRMQTESTSNPSGSAAAASASASATPKHQPHQPHQTLQPQPQQPLQKRKTFLAVGRSLWHARGIRGLYQGCGITVARSAPSSAFIFAVYEALKEWFG
ncbi:MAG: hypothetical protein M1837_006571 [Sclerophora amabilis]|nr:MAG: hypothetical protein M1837_006571 [Sclerophora amabilis]